MFNIVVQEDFHVLERPYGDPKDKGGKVVVPSNKDDFTKYIFNNQ